MAKKMILLIDDDEDLCQEMGELLRSEGYQVKGISDTSHVEEYLDKYTFDVAILDYRMPGLSGIDIVKMIHKKNSGTKVFIITGLPFFERLLKKEKVSGMVSEVIYKPFTEKDLLEKIKTA